jgi:hypothetical protein
LLLRLHLLLMFLSYQAIEGIPGLHRY